MIPVTIVHITGICVATETTNIFNAIAFPSAEMWRRLAYHEAIENDSIGAIAGRIIQKREVRESAERRGRDVADMMVLASRERIEKFQEKLRLLEQASQEALFENEVRLNEAQRRLEDIRNRAYEITMPNGQIAKVYRDGDDVRDDDGAVVSREWVRAADIPDAFPTWPQRKQFGETFESLKQERREIMEYQRHLERTGQAIERDGVTEEEIEKLEAGVADKAPASVRRKYEESGLTLRGTAPRQEAASTAIKLDDQEMKALMPAVSAPGLR